MRIRPVTATDRSEWLRLLLRLYDASTDVDHVPSIEAFLSGHQINEHIPAAVFVAERPDGRLGGVLELSVRDYAEGCTGATPYVESWYVEEDLHGMDIGRSLMRAAETWSREHGYHEIASDALIDNDASHAAHTALGFEEVERIVVFRKTLTS